MGDLTENFSSSEFECHCLDDCVAKNPAMQMDADFMNKLQALREVYGGSLTVTSGVRCEKHNESIGGKPDSAHLSAVAADAKIQITRPSPTFSFLSRISEQFMSTTKTFTISSAL